MASAHSTTIRRLQTAIRERFGINILLNKNEFYSEQQERIITFYSLKKPIIDDKTGKKQNIELFNSCSTTHIILYLRDMWYELNGWEIPKDEKWEKTKQVFVENKKVHKKDINTK